MPRPPRETLPAVDEIPTVEPWPQVRLRTLLLAVAVSAVLCGLIRTAWKSQAAFIAYCALSGLASFLAANGLVYLGFGLFAHFDRLVALVRRPEVGPPNDRRP